MNGIPVLDALEDALVRGIAADQARQGSEASVPLRRRRVPRSVGVGVAAAAVLFGVSVIGIPWPSGGGNYPRPSRPLGVAPAAALVSVQTSGDVMRIEIAQLAASPSAVEKALRAKNVPIDIAFVAASPSMVGKLVSTADAGDGDQEITYRYQRGGTVEGDVTVVEVPAGYRSEGRLTIGRRALAGELYGSAAITAAAPGEDLHCVDLYSGRTVGQLLAQIEERKVIVRWRDDQNRDTQVSAVRDQFVNAATPLAPGEVLITTQKAAGNSLTPAFLRQLEEGC